MTIRQALAAYSVAVIAVGLVLTAAPADEPGRSLTPLVRVVDLSVGETADVRLSNGAKATVELISLEEQRDRVRQAVRQAIVTLRVNGQQVAIPSATYHLPRKVGNVQVDCAVTKGYNSNGRPATWGLDKDARIRLWPADSPWIRPGTFMYPVKQRWFASHTQMANVPTFVDNGEVPSRKTNIYYHDGLDIGGAEGLVEVVAATDGLVVSSGQAQLEETKRDSPVRTRYDVVYVRDARGWYYRYSHLKEIDSDILPGRTVKMGQRIGILGKEGGSGGWSHLHFGIKSRQPSGKWGTVEGYAFLWQSYQHQYKPDVIAVARPHHLVWVGEEVVLDGSKSWSRSGSIASYQWQFDDGTTATGPRVTRTYDKPGQYSEVLRVSDKNGNVDYDFAVVIAIDRERPDDRRMTIHAAYAPTFGIHPGDPVTFKVRSFANGQAGNEVWDFGDGSPRVTVRSDGNADQHAKDGYAVTTHRFAKPGHYIVRVERVRRDGVRAVGHLDVLVEDVANDK